MSTDEKEKIWLDKLLHHQINLKTYKSDLDVPIVIQEKCA